MPVDVRRQLTATGCLYALNHPEDIYPSRTWRKEELEYLCRIRFMSGYGSLIAENSERGDILKRIQYQNSMLMRGITS